MNLSKRYSVFSQPMEKDTQDAARKLLRRARLTLTEYLLFESIVLSLSKPEQAIQEIQDHIKAMSVVKTDDADAPLKPSELHPPIWKAAQSVVKRVKL